MLRPSDEQYLVERGQTYTVTQEGSGLAVVIDDFAVPSGLTPSSTRLLILLPAGFNDAAPDMFWCHPHLQIAGGGGQPPGTDARKEFQGEQWQRWSRHIGRSWRPGIDNLATYLAYVRRCVIEAAQVAA